MDLDQFDQSIQAMRRRVMTLYQARTAQHQEELLPQAFEELQSALEELQVAEEQLRQKSQELLTTSDATELELRRYQELFEEAPIGYIVTSLDGTVHQANHTAAILLDSKERSMIGRSLALFVPEGQRRTFRAAIARLPDLHEPHEWQLRMRAWSGAAFDATLYIGVARSSSGRPTGLRWLLREVSGRQSDTRDLQAAEVSIEQRGIDRTASLGALGAARGEREAGLGRQRYAFLAEASVLLAISLDHETTLAQIANLAVPAMADMCAVDLLDQDGALRRLATARGPRAQQQADPAPQPDLTQRLRAGQSQIVADSTMVVPLCLQERAHGVLTFTSLDPARRYSADDLALVEELARRAVIAIEKARLYRTS